MSEPLPLQPGDTYLDESGLLVFTAQYLKRRGYCCQNGCRHCPYGFKRPPPPPPSGSEEDGSPA